MRLNVWDGLFSSGFLHKGNRKRFEFFSEDTKTLVKSLVFFIKEIENILLFLNGVIKIRVNVWEGLFSSSVFQWSYKKHLRKFRRVRLRLVSFIKEKRKRSVFQWSHKTLMESLVSFITEIENSSVLEWKYV